MVCYNVSIRKNPPKYKCKEGTVVWLPVYGVYQGENEITAPATCINGKYKFENDDWNYKPTQGTNKCVPEGKIFIEGQDKGNPGVKYQCQNGKAVKIN